MFSGVNWLARWHCLWLTIHLDAPFGKGEKTGLANPDIGVAAVAYAKGSWRWWYGVDAYTPGAQYTKGDLINVGQHTLATAPEAAFSWLPHNGGAEVSSKVQYIVNFADSATQYRSGNEFIWEYDASRNITRKFSAGINGAYYRQTGDDTRNGMLMSDTRGRSVLLGPQFKYRARRANFILKYQKEMLVQNKTRGNSFWLQIGMPLGHRG